MFDSIDILGNMQRAGVVEFYFEDGDGDIGIRQPLIGVPDQDTINLYFHQYNKENGVFDVPEDTLNYRIPYIERIGQNQVIRGTIEITFLYIGFSEDDTIKYDFYLLDRASHKSNIATSCEISFFGEGGCIDAIN